MQNAKGTYGIVTEQLCSLKKATNHYVNQGNKGFNLLGTIKIGLWKN